MNKFKLIIILTVILLLMSCDFTSPRNNTENNLTDHFTDYALIKDEFKTEFIINEIVPDFDDYLVITDQKSVKNYEISTVLSEKSVFDETGEFIVKFILYFENEQSLYYDLHITVNENNQSDTYNYYLKLQKLLIDISESNYLRYDTKNDVTFNIDGINRLQYNSNYEYYITEYTGENMFHVFREFDFNGETDITETYFYFDLYNTNFYVNSRKTNYEWTNEVVSHEEYFEELARLGDKIIFNLLDGITSVNLVSEDSTSKTFQIPCTTENFSIRTTTDIKDTISFFGVINLNSEEIYSLISDKYNLIKINIKTNSSITNILEIEYDYTLFLNLIFSVGNSDKFENAIYKEFNFNNNNFELTLPYDVLYEEIKNTSTTMVDAGGVILDSLVDEQNNQVFYTLSGSKYLYAYNYETHNINFVSFDLFPEHIFLRNGKLYVSLFNGEHKYYWPIHQQYGAFGVVDAENVLIEKVFNLNFDPADIVVDKDDFVYIIHGSNQQCSIESYNPISGMKIASISQVDFDGTLLYSDYTNRIYEIENHSSKSNFEIFSLDRGILSSVNEGNEGFIKNSLKVSSNGQEIYSGNGIVFELTKQSGLDTQVTHDLGFDFHQVAFNDVDGLRYFSQDGIISALDINDELQYAMLYSGSSEALHYEDGLLFNIYGRYIEILDLEYNNEIPTDELVTNISINDSFNPTQYINSVTNGMYELKLISNNLDISAVGTYEVLYEVKSVFNVEVDMQLKLYVNVLDNVSPVITINDEPSTIHVGDSYTPPGCTARDNVDGFVSCKLFKNSVNPNKLGDYEIIYKALDSKGNTIYETKVITVALNKLNYNGSPINITADVSDVEFDIKRNAFYYIDYGNNKLIKYSLFDNNITEIQFNLQPEHMTIDGNTLYITILTGEHSSFWRDEDQTGKIAMIDLESFTLSNIYDIGTDPYSINIYSDYLYIGPGSGQWVYLHVYNKKTMEFLGESCLVIEKQDLQVDINTGYLYAPRNGSPTDIEKFLVDGPNCMGKYDSPYHGDYEFGRELFISPYQDYLFTSNGTYYAYKPVGLFKEMNYEGDLGFEFSEMYFDTVSEKVYFGLTNGYIYVAKTENGYNPYGEINTGYAVSKIYAYNDIIYIFSIDRSSKQFVFVEVNDVRIKTGLKNIKSIWYNK